jgi:hypothetical protein
MATPFTTDVFKGIDSMQSAAFAKLFAPEGQIVFGNAEPIVGPAAIEAGAVSFYSTIKGLHHDVVQEWNNGPDTILELKVTYDRHDGEAVTIPVVTIWTVGDDGLFVKYRIFFDLAPVYA